MRIALLLGIPLLAAAVLLLTLNALLRIALLARPLLGVALLTAAVLLLLTLNTLLLGIALLPHALAAVAVLLLLGMLLPLPVLLAGDRLLTAVPGVARMPRLGALGAVAPTQIGH
ncbi:hypothetical protein [Streptomyces sp. NRRL S-495]|uniref:hypothetical protein n=1 Tax=Streptomyces sp. NRRL S-495 TaxID=1609133 RepID=UPI0006981204|nr:hypothetical protein [Streptomyces sp. NRRL S-495]